MRHKCPSCGCEDYWNFRVPDEIWRAAVPDRFQNGAVCLQCFDKFAVKRAIQYAHKLGITSELRPELGLALGSSCVTMADLTDVYALFANYGERVPRRFITRVLDRDGNVLEDDGWYGDPWAGVDLKIERAVRQARAT